MISKVNGSGAAGLVRPLVASRYSVRQWAEATADAIASAGAPEAVRDVAVFKLRMVNALVAQFLLVRPTTTPEDALLMAAEAVRSIVYEARHTRWVMVFEHPTNRAAMQELIARNLLSAANMIANA